MQRTFEILNSKNGLWALCVALIVGGLLGISLQSIPAFFLFGLIGWAFTYFDIFHVAEGVPLASHKDTHCEEGGAGFYLNRTDALLHGAMFRMDGDDDNGPGFYM